MKEHAVPFILGAIVAAVLIVVYEDKNTAGNSFSDLLGITTNSPQ